MPFILDADKDALCACIHLSRWTESYQICHIACNEHTIFKLSRIINPTKNAYVATTTFTVCHQ